MADSDITPPQILSFSLSATNIDVSNSGQVVTATMRLTDDLSGVSGASVYFRSPSGKQSVSAYISFSQPSLGRTLDGINSGELNFPRYCESGQWSLYQLSLSDNAHNNKTLYYENIVALGFPSHIAVQGTSDTTAPQIVSFILSRTSVDTSLSNQTITATVGIVDDLSGFGSSFYPFPSGSASFQFRSPSGGQSVSAYFSPYNRQSGSPNAGVYTNVLFFPRYSEPGSWTLFSARLSDDAGNGTNMTVFDFLRLGLPAQINVTGPGDTTPPQLAGISLSSVSVDATSSDTNLTFVARLTDDLSGLVGANSGVFGGINAYAIFSSPSRSHSSYVSYYTVAAPQLSNSLDGYYTNTIVIPQYSEAGVWSMTSFYVQDAAGNYRNFEVNDIAALGFPYQFTVVVQPDLKMTKSADVAIVSWPQSPGYVLQSANILVPSTNWAPISVAPLVIGNQNVVAAPYSNGSNFFRLFQSGGP